MRDKLSLLVGILALLIAVAAMSVFVVDQRQYAIVFQLGEVKDVVKEPGLKFKLPLIQNVRYFDRRILTMDTSSPTNASGFVRAQSEPERFLTSEKQNVIVDYFVKWRIVDPRLYYQAVGEDESRARDRLNQAINAGLREEFGRRTVHDVISGERDAIMRQMSERADKDARSIGVEIVDVRLKRVEYPDEVSANVYSRMQAERQRVANERRARGTADAEKIRAEADRQRTIIIAEAQRDAQRIKGEGDAGAAAIYAEAYSADPEFYAFYRSLEAYRASFASKQDVIVVAPDADFFKYLKAPRGAR
ncbi:MAG: protease modulator HflC [Azoarcus sp.]|jgi:membrane protease subunit HflC|nr:protease modulator HflC [Azoarcus sp.]